MRISDWSSDVCSSDLDFHVRAEGELARGVAEQAIVVQRGVPLRQVVDRGVDAAVAAGGAGDALVGACPAAVLLAVAIGAFVHVRATAYVHQGVIHVQRPEDRSEEHTSELQSLMRISYAVFCLKKKNK